MEGGCEGMEGLSKKGKRIHGHGKQCGDYWKEGSIRGLSGIFI